MPTDKIRSMTSAEVIRCLDLKPHPEGGHYRETLRDPACYGDRSVSTAIYFLLAAGEISNWHRIDAIEVWHWYGGAPLELAISTESDVIRRLVVGPNLASGERPQVAVPGGAWQSAKSLGEWTLVGCTVAPGFQFDRFELAPSDWEPGKREIT
jgi:predicted cupin superfamily sugar epimerase